MAGELQGIIIGYGTMGRVHQHAAEVNGASIVGVVDSDPTQQPGEGILFSSSLTDLKDVNPDFAVVSSPTPAHLGHVDELVQRFEPSGLQGILLEKPPVRTAEELTRLRSIAQVFGHICIGEVEHYNPKLAPFMSFPDTPEHIRMIRSVNLEYFLHGERPWFLDEEQSGGVVLDAMIHDLNLLVSKYGTPKAIKLAEGEKRHYGVYDNVRTVLGYDNFEVEIECSWTASDDTKPIQVFIDQDGQQLHCDDYIDTHADDSNPYVLQMRRFIDSLQTQELPFPLDGYLDATDLALQIRDRLDE